MCISLRVSTKAGTSVDARHAVAGEERVVETVRPGQRRGMAHRHLGAEPRAAGLQDDEGHALAQRQDRRLREQRRVLDAFDVQADGGDARVGEQRLDIVAVVADRLVATAMT